jgi:hypothetical protein
MVDPLIGVTRPFVVFVTERADRLNSGYYAVNRVRKIIIGLIL